MNQIEIEAKWEEIKIAVNQSNQLRLVAINKSHIEGFGIRLKNENTNVNVEVLVEYDRKYPYFGIYYGCRLNNGDQKHLFVSNDTIWQDYKHDCCNQEYWLEKDNLFLLWHDHNRDNSYWPFWIMVKLGENWDDIHRGMKSIIDCLKKNGYSVVSQHN